MSSKPEQRQAAPGKVERYWPGKAPKFAEEEDDVQVPNEQQSQAPVAAAPVPQPVQKPDRRLQRLAESQAEVGSRREREVYTAEVVRARPSAERSERREPEPAPVADEDDSDDEDARRKRIRAKALERLREQELAAQQQQPEEEEDEEDEEDEEVYTDESSEDDMPGRQMLKPVFVPKTNRDTIAEAERLEQEEEARLQAAKAEKESRKVESRQLVAEEIQKDKLGIQLRSEASVQQVDTDDEENAAEEFEGWKLRELRRIKRDREERDKFEREKAEVERRRKMTDDEIRDEDRKLGINQPKAKGKMRFMQKYYHKGAFFMDNEDRTTHAEKIYDRDYAQPVQDETSNIESMPKAMQVRRGEFGRAGRTKWTHLVKEDTTDFNAAWGQKDAIASKMQKRMGGMKSHPGPVGRSDTGRS